MDKERKEIFSERILAGKRTYYLDVKESENGTRYLVISESRRSENGQERERILIFDEDIVAFWGGMKKAVKCVLGEIAS